MRRLPALALALSLLAPVAGFSQTLGTPADVVTQVVGLAPQLVAFAGSDTNFRNLVLGLSQGTPVTLVTATPDGLTQTVTFTPSGTMSATDIVRTLETARQQLISRGVAAPSALQIGTTLVGGTLPTPAGTVQVNPVLTQAGAMTAPSASTGASAPRLGAVNPTPSNLSVTSTPTTTVTTTGGTTTSTTGTTTSGTTTGGTATPAAPGVVFSAPNPVFTSTPAPATTSPNGAPSPAVQMQGRR